MKPLTYKMIKIIGCGNILASDDGIGIEVIKKLKSKIKLSKDVEVIEAGLAGLNLLDYMSSEDKVIIVDAMVTKSKPGIIRKFTRDNLPPNETFPLSLHGLSIIDIIKFGETLYSTKLPSQIIIFGIEVKDISPRVGLSREVSTVIPKVIDLILQEIN
jgi:hydrogenase maturation protease